MSFMLFYTDFVGEGLYEGVPSALPGSMSKQRYDEGQISSLSTLVKKIVHVLVGHVLSKLIAQRGIHVL